MSIIFEYITLCRRSDNEFRLVWNISFDTMLKTSSSKIIFEYITLCGLITLLCLWIRFSNSRIVTEDLTITVKLDVMCVHFIVISVAMRFVDVVVTNF